MAEIRVLELAGTHYEMGFQHGKTYHDEIHHFTEDRIKLCMDADWTGQSLSRDEVIALAEACVAEHQKYSPELMEELQGMADATKLSLAELIINNGFTDFIDTIYKVGNPIQESKLPELVADNCTAFLVPQNLTADKNSMFGQTWDMHDSATPYVILLRGKPQDEPNFLTFTITGCVGMIGMNSAGITVGINNISAADGQVGVTWNFVIRKVLMQTNIEDALACITSAKLAGAHNYLLMDKNGKGYNIEAMSTRYNIQELHEEQIVHTNHCVSNWNQKVERKRPPESQEHSEKRLNRGMQLLNRSNITPEDLMELTADDEAICVPSTPPKHVETCGAAIMRPATGDFWAVWGAPNANQYQRFMI